jgi:hypothetical protein
VLGPGSALELVEVEAFAERVGELESQLEVQQRVVQQRVVPELEEREVEESLQAVVPGLAP